MSALLRVSFLALTCFALNLPLIWSAETRQPDPDSGIYAIWYAHLPEADQIMALPFVKGGQVWFKWGDCEPAPGQYDWTKLDAGLKKLHELGRRGFIDLSGDSKPAWLYDKVASLKSDAATIKRYETRDSHGLLQFWDPVYENAYRDVIFAFAKHLKQSPYKENIAGVRQSFCAIGTEFGYIDPQFSSWQKWTPAPNGHIEKSDWTHEVYNDYRRFVIKAFIEAMRPEIRVLMRNEVFSNDLYMDPVEARNRDGSVFNGPVTPEQIKGFESGDLAMMFTAAWPEPFRWHAIFETQCLAFMKYCRNGKAFGYAESQATAEGSHGPGKHQVLDFSPCQNVYWTMLCDLHCGISAIAVYGADFKRADDPEFRSAFAFAAKYAGQHVNPATAPGAWVALREGNSLKGDYNNAMMERIDGGKAVEKIGPPEQRFGIWARAIDAGQSMRFRLNREFADSLNGKPCKLRVVYFDEGQNSFTVQWGEGAQNKQSITKKNTGKWQEISIDIPKADFVADSKSPDLQLSSTDGSTIFHMVELQR